MEQKSIDFLVDTLLNWSTIDVRTVPGVMYQVLCRKDNTYNNIEYRFHWFVDCTETYIHNHRFTFDTYCLEGEYMETLWKIIDDGNDTTTYEISRTTGNKLGLSRRKAGALCIDKRRYHFPGNILHVETNQFHSIACTTQSNDHVFTFVARQMCSSPEENTYILSQSESIKAPTDEIQAATPEERQRVYLKLLQILDRILF